MRDYIDIGCAPHCEDCAQLGSDDYQRRAASECAAYIRQLRRMFGPEPPGARLAIKSNDHDFGEYLSVVCWFDQDVPAAVDYAFHCEGQGPQLWDEQAQRELGQASPQPSSPRKENVP
jgi:hypothetical protein